MKTIHAKCFRETSGGTTMWVAQSTQSNLAAQGVTIEDAKASFIKTLTQHISLCASVFGQSPLIPHVIFHAGLCECALCQRGRRYYKNAESLPQEERDWMCRFYDAVIDKECEFEMYEAHNQEANSSG